MFYILYSGVRSRSGEQIRPIADQTLKGPPMVGDAIISFEDRTLWGAAHSCMCIVKFPRASAHICTLSTHMYVGFDSCLITPARPHSLVALAQFLFSRAKERRLSTANFLALHVFNSRICCSILRNYMSFT